jgi:hypothetical protein
MRLRAQPSPGDFYCGSNLLLDPLLNGDFAGFGPVISASKPGFPVMA